MYIVQLIILSVTVHVFKIYFSVILWVLRENLRALDHTHGGSAVHLSFVHITRIELWTAAHELELPNSAT